MKIVYFGSGAFGLPTLDALVRAHEVVAVVTQPDRRAGRGGEPAPTPVAARVRGLGVPVIKPERVNEPGVCAQIRSFEADAWVVIAFGQKLPPTLLADRFAINLHASLLPRWRGAAPIHAAIVAGDAETGNSVITLADRMDAGLVLGRTRRAIEPTQTAGDLHDLLARDGEPVVLEVLSRHISGDLEPESQDESQATPAPKLSKADGWVDFSDHADRCRCRINGLSPWPGVVVGWRGEPLKILRADSQPAGGVGPPGTITAGGLVSCGGGSSLRLIEVQPAGRRVMEWQDFARGRSIEAGEALTGI